MAYLKIQLSVLIFDLRFFKNSGLSRTQFFLDIPISIGTRVLARTQVFNSGIAATQPLNSGLYFKSGPGLRFVAELWS